MSFRIRTTRTLALLMAVLLTLTLTACGAQGSASSTPAASGSPSASGGSEKAGGTVIWWTWSTEAGDAYAAQVDYIQKQNPKLKVNIEYTSNADFFAKLPVAVSSGSGPDIFQMTRPSLELYAASKQTMDLTEIVANSPALSAYMNSLSPQLQDSYKIDGKLMGIPYTIESTAIAYNKDAFAAAGLPDLKEIEDTWTWDDFAELAQKLTIKDSKGEYQQYGAWLAAERIPLWEKVWSAGYEFFNEQKDVCTIGQEGIIKAYQPIVDLYLAGVSPNSVDAPNPTYGDDLFISGKIAMIPAGIWKVPSYKKITTFNWDVVELPFDPISGKRVTASNVLGICVNPNTKNLDATIAALEEYVNADCMKIVSDMGIYIPALESVRDAYFNVDVPENIEAFRNALEYIHPNTLTQYIPYGQFNNTVADATKKAYSGQMSLEESFKALEAEINKVMEENKAQFAS